MQSPVGSFIKQRPPMIKSAETRKRPILAIHCSFIGLICLLLMPGWILSSHAQERTPNIIFILADDLGYGDLSCYGQKRFSTPNIDRLAREGMKFTNHYAGAPVCAPSRSALTLNSPNRYILLVRSKLRVTFPPGRRLIVVCTGSRPI